MLRLASSSPAPNSMHPPNSDQYGPNVPVHRPASSAVPIISAVIGRNTSAILPPESPTTSSR